MWLDFIFTLSSLEHMSTFESRKHQVVSSLVETLDAERRDKSPKGFIDAPILNLIHIINRHCDYYTTSSCSGRIAIYCEGLEEQEGLEKTTKGGKWLYVSHDPVEIPSDADDEWIKKLLFGSEYHRLCNPTAAAPGDAEDIMKQQLIFFKFEPLVSPNSKWKRKKKKQICKAFREILYRFCTLRRHRWKLVCISTALRSKPDTKTAASHLHEHGTCWPSAAHTNLIRRSPMWIMLVIRSYCS